MAYNLAAISFSVTELADEIRKKHPKLEVTYEPDSRQSIADSWPNSIDDSAANKDWGWQHSFGLDDIVDIMLENVHPD
jgi:nucleoside-diphosphate-sugar epimerase